MIPTGLTILGAQSKAGQSWLALQLALCVAAGLPFLGKFRTTQGNVLYLALEDTERRIKDRIKQLGIPAQTQCKMTQCKIMTQWADDFDALEYALQQKKYELVIIDTWGRFVSAVCKDGNDYAETTRLATCLHTLAKQYETCIIAITHTKKDATSADWLDNVIGSKGLVAVADTILSITRERHSDCGELKITGRDVSEEKLQIEHGDDWLWKLSENQDLTAAHQRILQELQQGEKTIRDLQQRLYQYKVSGGATAVESLLNELLHGNYVETYVSETTAKGGRPTAYWRLTAGSFE
jgi:hypothetical protein